jgi:hypothetical protein
MLQLTFAYGVSPVLLLCVLLQTLTEDDVLTVEEQMLLRKMLPSMTETVMSTVVGQSLLYIVLLSTLEVLLSTVSSQLLVAMDALDAVSRTVVLTAAWELAMLRLTVRHAVVTTVF